MILQHETINRETGRKNRENCLYGTRNKYNAHLRTGIKYAGPMNLVSVFIAVAMVVFHHTESKIRLWLKQQKLDPYAVTDFLGSRAGVMVLRLLPNVHWIL